MKFYIITGLLLISTLTNTALAIRLGSGESPIYVCNSDPAGVEKLLNSGRVVVQRSNSSSCGTGGVRFKFSYPSKTSTTVVCYPSTPNNLPDGYVIIGKNSYSSCGTGANFSQNGYKIKRPSASGTTRVCDVGGKIPTGFAVTTTNISSSSCNTSSISSTTEINIRRPSTNRGTRTHDCQLPLHELPPGYVITGYVHDRDCRSGTTQSGLARIITLPRIGQTTTVCQGSPIPAGFAYFGSGRYFGCGTIGTGYGQGFEIGPVTGSTAYICGREESDVPPGYVVTAISNSTACEGSYKSWTVKRLSATSATNACQISGTLPAGYVVTSVYDSTACGKYHSGYTLKKPSGNRQFICQAATPSIPNGWGVTSQSTSSSCARSNSVFNASAIISPLTGNGPYSICGFSTSSLPEGFVINKVVSLWSCFGDAGITIVRPNEKRGRETVVCGNPGKSIPPGFAVVGIDDFHQCSGALTGLLISKPRLSGDTLVCAGSPIPSEFAVIKSSGTYSSCGVGAKGGPGSIIRLVSGNGPFYICLGSPIPDGYVITSNTDNSSHCSGDLGNKISLPNSSGATGICRGSPVPTDYVVTEFTSNSGCSSNAGWRIQRPNATGKTFMCSVADIDIPSGFIQVVGSQQNTSSCATLGNGFGFAIIAEGGGQTVVPRPFINTEADVPTKPSNPAVTCSVGNVDAGLVGSAKKNKVGCN